MIPAPSWRPSRDCVASSPAGAAANGRRNHRATRTRPGATRADGGCREGGGGCAARQILVEAFVPGAEVALEGLLTAACCARWPCSTSLTRWMDRTSRRRCTSPRHGTPAATQAAVEEAVRHAARALGLETGPVHAEVRLGPDGPVVIEVAARTIGGLCSRTLRFGTGLSLEDLVIRQATGQFDLSAAAGTGDAPPADAGQGTSSRGGDDDPHPRWRCAEGRSRSGHRACRAGDRGCGDQRGRGADAGAAAGGRQLSRVHLCAGCFARRSSRRRFAPRTATSPSISHPCCPWSDRGSGQCLRPRRGPTIRSSRRGADDDEASWVRVG